MNTVALGPELPHWARGRESEAKSQGIRDQGLHTSRFFIIILSLFFINILLTRDTVIG